MTVKPLTANQQIRMAALEAASRLFAAERDEHPTSRNSRDGVVEFAEHFEKYVVSGATALRKAQP